MHQKEKDRSKNRLCKRVLTNLFLTDFFLISENLFHKISWWVMLSCKKDFNSFFKKIFLNKICQDFLSWLLYLFLPRRIILCMGQKVKIFIVFGEIFFLIFSKIFLPRTIMLCMEQKNVSYFKKYCLKKSLFFLKTRLSFFLQC